MFGAGRELNAAAREHVSSCSSCSALVETPLSAEIQQRLAAMVTKDLAPVRPLSLTRYFLSFLACAWLAVLTGALLLGGAGWRVSTLPQQLWLIPGLLVLAIAAPALLARLMIPGARVWIRPAHLLWLAAIWFALAALLIYPAQSYPAFARSASACLLIGLGFAAVVASAAWLILQQGFVTAPGVAAITAGGLAGTSSLALQFIYCPHLDSGHFALAHLGSFLLSIVLGWLLLRNAALERLRKAYTAN